MRFVEFLLNEEVNVTLDPKDPEGSMKKASDMLRAGQRDPQIAVKKRQQNLDARKKEIDATDDKDVKAAEEDIRRDEERIARKRQNLANLKKRKGV